MNKTIDKGISDIVGCLTDPIIVFSGGWGDSVPDWLKIAITLERMMDNMKALKGEEPTGTDAEVCAYLMTASLTQPIDSDWTNIYLYVAGKTYAKWNKNQIPENIRVESLTDEQMRDLNRLKEWLYQQRIKARLERDRADRREKREEAEAKHQKEQPVLFKF